MRTDEGTVEFDQIPTLVVVRRELSKAGHQYLTFLSEEGCEYIKDYLEERMREGEELNRDSPIVTPKLQMKPFIRAVNIGDAVREAIRKADYPWRPYVLRSYFDTQLMLAESKGLQSETIEASGWGWDAKETSETATPRTNRDSRKA